MPWDADTRINPARPIDCHLTRAEQWSLRSTAHDQTVPVTLSVRPLMESCEKTERRLLES